MKPLITFYGTARKKPKFGLGWSLPIKLLIYSLLIAGIESSRISTINFKEFSARNGQLPFKWLVGIFGLGGTKLF
jgi:hypothetical protein